MYDPLCLFYVLLLQLYDDIVRKGIFCGTITPQVTMTIRSELHMHFHSDDEISGTGFNLSYSLVPGMYILMNK